MKLAALLILTTLVVGPPPQQSTPTLERLYTLEEGEGVFAYARISPNGRHLAYASEVTLPKVGMTRTVRVVDLKTKKIIFTESGIDPYWSLDGKRFIYSSSLRVGGGVTIRHLNGKISRDIAPANLGDYYSWGVRDGREMILTITGRYYYLDGDTAILPAKSVTTCPGIGAGDRPLLSKDGRQITTFVQGNVIVRNLDNCDSVTNTGLPGAKADFSWDGRYVAFHVAKGVPSEGYEIAVVDLKERTVRTITNLKGSAFFPSWTEDGRLAFRYDGPEYRGFMMASNVLAAPARPLPAVKPVVPQRVGWVDLFPETARPTGQWTVVMVWAPWSAHMPETLRDFQRARDDMQRRGGDVAILTATDPASHEQDVTRLLRGTGAVLPRIPLTVERLPLSYAQNQIPTNLLFRDGELVSRHLGPLDYQQLTGWLKSAQAQER